MKQEEKENSMNSTVETEIENYLVNVVEESREEFGNMAVCPFAKGERISGKLRVGTFDPGKIPFDDLVRETIERGYQSGLFAVFQGDTPVQISHKDTKKFQVFLNKTLRLAGLREYKTICFNPNDQVSVDGYNPRSLAPFLLINFASRDILNSAHKSLTKTKYFDRLSTEYRKFLKMDP